MMALLRTARRHAASPFPLVLAWALILPGAGVAQKPALDHDAYDRWRTIEGERISADGRWVLYHLEPRVGDGRLVVTRRAEEAHHVERARGARFSSDARFVVFTIKPAHDSVRSLKLAKTKPADMPGDTLGILSLATGAVERIPDVRSWRLPERSGGVLTYLIGAHAPDTAAAPADTAAAANGEEGSDRPEPDPGTLVVRDLTSGSEHRYPGAVEVALSADGSTVAYTASSEDGAGDGVFLVDPGTGAARPLLTGKGTYTRLTVSADGGGIAFLSDRDDPDAEEPAFALFVWTAGRDDARRVAGEGTGGIPAGWWVSEHGALRFSDSGRRLFFGTAPRPAPAPTSDSLLADEQVRLDVWHWQEGHIQPMQLLNAESERNRTYEAVVHLDARERVVQLATEAVPTVDVGGKGDADIALADSDAPYRALVGIEAPGFSDLWLIDVRDGTRRRIVENRQVGSAALSPGARYVAWYDFADRHWHGYDVRSDRAVVLTAGLPYPAWNEDDDRPMPPTPHGRAGWTEGDRELLVYDRFDIWAVDPAGRASPRAITGGVGRDRGIRFRYIDLDPQEPAVPRDGALLLSAFDLRTRDAGFFRLDAGGRSVPEELVLEPRRFSAPVRAEAGTALLYTREDVAEFPDLWVAGPRLEAPLRVSDANPQQAEYNWATVELVDWVSTDGTPLQGLLYRPEDFDPRRRYPMLVNFYERDSDNLHRHVPPVPHRSVIRPTFYASRGYVVFMPDIVYQEGYPGKSAMDAVMPGTLMLAAEPWVDETNVGVQGHSWGGYQIAYMLTRTGFFKAAGAGAPVANMTSAYGGIRWGTGLSRVFQYERTQSRIGGSLWDRTARYIENSPLFYLDRVETPVLIMHNDEDDAVPFEQGIELFMGLRRLGKPAWLINYNEQPHWPVTAANIRDWNIRMQQFFDHFLKGAPPPRWLVDGIPATDKGRTLGLELVEPQGAARTTADGESR